MTDVDTLDLIALGQRVRDARAAANAGAGITQGELARLAGLTQKHVSNVERADGRPSISTIVAIARALAVTVDELVGA